ncbi:YopX family protein [Lapidilactobacillus gannanensis]|uniref:YopX family protein n=1 Tax=Lapidilactobacillus gannanensis TaxID=2486002 RepID=A0ABW4BLD0_9LACO|nr:YopX family protein [Lapidilactobacillus gannanensis]
MREIKFRAWDKGQECYLYDVQGAYDTLSGWVKYENGENADYDEECFDDFLNSDQYVVEQYTGLTDVNGKDIYEGDLVRLTDDLEDPVFRVIFDEAKFEISGDDLFYDLGEEFMNCEVIGNVHENPELLEAKSNATDNESQG